MTILCSEHQVYDFKLKNLNTQEVNELLPPNLIMLGYRGSVAHGTHVMPDDSAGIDDKDLMGAFVAPLNHYFGFAVHDHHEKFIKEEADRLFKLAELAYINSKLPDRSDFAAAEKLLMEIIVKFHQLINTRFGK